VKLQRHQINGTGKFFFLESGTSKILLTGNIDHATQLP